MTVAGKATAARKVIAVGKVTAELCKEKPSKQ